MGPERREGPRSARRGTFVPSAVRAIEGGGYICPMSVDRLADEAALRSVYRSPSALVIAKAIDHIDDGVRAFIAQSPWFVLATSDGDTADASPRGGPPGFVRVIDDRHLAWGDLTGNNRLDSFTNVVAQPAIGMLFVIPGLLETLRVNGRASLTTDPEICERCAIDGRRPKVAVVVEVTDSYIHCGASLRRARLWDTSTWPAPDERPPVGQILKAHTKVEASAREIEENLADYYDHGIWNVGGARDD